MSETVIAGFTIEGWNFPGTTFRLRIVATSQFTAEGGETVMQGSAGKAQEVYRTVVCTANTTTKVLTVPSFTLPNTTDAVINPQAAYTGVIYSSAGARLKTLFENFSLPESFGGTASFEEWAIYNQGRTLQSPPRSYLTSDETLALVRSAVNVGNPASVSAIGRVRTSVPPSDPANPEAVITDDPQYINARDATKIQARDVSSTQPLTGQVLAYNAAASEWQPTSLEPFMLALIMRDEFPDADGTLNAGRRPSHTNNPGSTWLNGAGTWTIEDNAVQPSSPFADGDYQLIDAGTSDLTLTCRVSADAGSSAPASASAGLIFRYVDANNYWVVVCDSRAGLVVLYEQTAGTFTARATINAAPASNVEIPLTVSANGSEIIMYLFGQSPERYVSAVHQSATIVGIRAGGNGGTPSGVPTFKQFAVLPVLSKSASNPIIPRGASGEWDDFMVAAPSRPVVDTANSRFVLAYSGFGSLTEEWATGFAYCPLDADPLDAGNWTKEATNPKLTPVAAEGYIAASAGLVVANDIWYLVYQGAVNATFGNPALPWVVHAASSPNMTNGGTWTRLNGGASILPLGGTGTFDNTGHHDPDIRLRTDGLFEIIFSARDGSGLFTFGHCVGESLTAMGATSQLFGGELDESLTGLLNPAFEGDDPDTYSVYFCYDVSTARQILRADTEDGGATFFFLNLVLAKSTGWDGVQVFDPAPFRYGGLVYLFYCGANALGGTETDADVGVASFTLPDADAQTWDGTALSFTSPPQTLTDAATVTWDFNKGQYATLTLGGDRTLEILNVPPGRSGCVVITQAAPGGWTLALPGGSLVVSGGGGVIGLSPTAGSVDILCVLIVGGTLYFNLGLNYTAL